MPDSQSMRAAALSSGIEPATNGAEESIAAMMPYIAVVRIEGCAPFLFHRWNNEAVAAKSAASKGSNEKKTDNLESYVYRSPDGSLAIPGEYLRQSVIHAAKFRQDPRSPRKSAMDLFKAGLVCLTETAAVGKKTWDYVDQRRVMIQRNGVTRFRPALTTGWIAEFQLMVNLPEYIPASVLNETIQAAGRLIGVGDFRPTYGRFNVTSFEVTQG